jgi:predicted transcriptional regulator
LDGKNTINIILVILQASNERADEDDDENKKTAAKTTSNAMYNALFNHPQLKEYWKVLIQKGLLSYDTNTKTFTTTTEGRAFLKACEPLDYDVMKARPLPRRRRQKQKQRQRQKQ